MLKSVNPGCRVQLQQDRKPNRDKGPIKTASEFASGQSLQVLRSFNVAAALENINRLGKPSLRCSVFAFVFVAFILTEPCPDTGNEQSSHPGRRMPNVLQEDQMVTGVEGLA